MAGKLHSKAIRDEQQVLLGTTLGRRCRIHCFASGEQVFGWIDQLTETGVRVALANIELDQIPKWDHNTRIVVELAGPKSLMVFVAQWVRQTGELLTIDPISVIDQRDLDSASRIRVHGIRGRIRAKDIITEVSVTDISASGIGFDAEGEMEPGSEVEVELDGSFGPMTLQATVRHINGAPDANKYRGGASIHSVDRLGKARWNRLVNEVNA
jgi:hypothetical protein